MARTRYLEGTGWRKLLGCALQVLSLRVQVGGSNLIEELLEPLKLMGMDKYFTGLGNVVGMDSAANAMRTTRACAGYVPFLCDDRL